MISISILGFGLATVAAARLTTQLVSRWWAPIGVIANLGLILAVQLTTVDTLAFALALWALVFWLDRRFWPAVTVMAAAGLAKEVYLLVTIGIVLGDSELPLRRRRVFLSLAGLPVLIWSGILAWILPGGTVINNNLGVPIVGILDSVRSWQTPSDMALGSLTLFTVLGATVALIATSHRLLRWSIVPWLVTAFISTSLVWGDANNALRAFAPLWFFVVLEAGRQIEQRPAGSLTRGLRSRAS
jgi:hypothetical protein